MSFKSFIAIAFVFLISCTPKSKFIENQGFVYGTIYTIKYESPDGKNYQKDIEAAFRELGNSLSPFIDTSIISKVNQNIEVIPDQYFIDVFKRGKEIAQITDGAFDFTVAPMVNAWGFGFKHKETITDKLIDSLIKTVGYQKISIEGSKIIKKNPNTMLDASAIAKGYTCDVIGNLLAEKGCTNYMVEIGGEVVVHGKNAKGNDWSIGILKPVDSVVPNQSELQDVLKLQNKGMATSGNYRNFYIENGNKYAHTIDPKSGYPVQHSILSATVVADDCMTADAFATAFMVMGLEQGKSLLENMPELGLEVYFIYADSIETNKVYMSNGFKNYIK